MSKWFFTLLFSLFLMSLPIATQGVSIVPLPKHIEQLSGEFQISASTKIVMQGKECMPVISLFQDVLVNNYGIRLPISSSGKNIIRFISDVKMEDERYELKVTKDEIQLIGNNAGLFYASQSLLQLIQIADNGKLSIPNVKIIDEPRFKYRGLMLDVGRYFYPVEYIKKFIDLMAFYKFNVFHWHLTEDAGWRIEIKKYPQLTQKGAWRSSTQHGDKQDRIPHGGFYTQEQIKDIVKYAADRHVTIIPEIEMPGHAMAALSVFPELSCTGGPFAIPLQWGIKEEIFCAGKEQTFEFLENVLSEVIELFPSKYIHIGGDEALKRRWKECPKCQERIKDEGLKDEHELQSYFVRRIEKFVNSKGKQIIGWDEILEGGIAPNATVMSWRGEEGGIAAASQGHDVIMTPNNYLYFDYYQSKDRANEPIGAHWYPLPVTLSDVYNYEPYTDRISTEHQKHIIGVQANIWMEMIHSEANVEYMTFPRALALAEVAWSPRESKSYQSFLSRLALRLSELDKKGVLFRIPEPEGWSNVKIESGIAIIQLTPPVAGSVIYYTTDGTDPSVYGKIYKDTLRIPLKLTGANVKCVVQLATGRYSGIYTLSSD